MISLVRAVEQAPLDGREGSDSDDNESGIGVRSKGGGHGVRRAGTRPS